MQEIYVEDSGSGVPLVLVHGFLGSSDIWQPQIKYFQKYYRVLCPALPGFGKSNKIESCDSIVNMARTILNTLEKKGIKKFYLLGHSMGGMIVQEMIRINNDKILKLICYGTGPIGNIPNRFETMDESKKKLKVEGLEKTAYRIAKTWFVEEDKAKYFYLCFEAIKQASLKATENGLIAMESWNGLNNLKNIKKETLIIWGDQDKSYNYDQVETLKNNIPNSSLKIIKGCSHNAHLERPDEFNNCLSSFLK